MEYYELERKSFAFFQKIVQDYWLHQLVMINKDKPINHYKPVDLKYLNIPKPVVGSSVIYRGPLIQYMLCNAGCVIFQLSRG